jgi:hypothetical protein
MMTDAKPVYLKTKYTKQKPTETSFIQNKKTNRQAVAQSPRHPTESDKDIKPSKETKHQNLWKVTKQFSTKEKLSTKCRLWKH